MSLRSSAFMFHLQPSDHCQLSQNLSAGEMSVTVVP